MSTGASSEETPTTVEERQGALEDIYTEVFGADAADTAAAPADLPTDAIALPDAEVIDLATNSKNGAEIAALLDGDTSAHGGNHSSADQALCNHLAFWTGGNRAQMDCIVRESGLMRPKWDETHNSAGDTSAR